MPKGNPAGYLPKVKKKTARDKAMGKIVKRRNRQVKRQMAY